MRSVTIAALMVVASITSAAAEQAGFTARQLLADCGGDTVRYIDVPEAYNLGICLGYTMAVTDQLVLSRLSCMPQG